MPEHFPIRRSTPRPGRRPARLLAVTAAAGAMLLTGLPAQAAPTPTKSPSRGESEPTVPRSSRPAMNEIAVPSTQQAASPRSGGQTPAGENVVAALPARATSHFTMVGVTWAGGTTGDPRVEVKLQRKGTWGDWEPLPAQDRLDSPGSKTRPGTAPAFVGDAEGIEVRAVAPSGVQTPKDLKAVLIDPEQLPTDAAPPTDPRLLARSVPKSSEQVSDQDLEAQRRSLSEQGTGSGQPPASPRAGEPQAPMPAIISRAGWGADESMRTTCDTPYSSTIRAVVVHHTEGTNSYTREQSPGIVRGMYAYHTNSNKWCDIGYNFLVDKYGQIFEGRHGGATLPVKGAHAVAWNTDTMGISLMGNFMSTMPTPAQQDAAVRLSAWRLAAYYRTPTGRITIGGKTADVIAGHRQVVETDCPGDSMYAAMPAFRQRVAATIGTIDTPIKRRWEQLGGARAVGEPFVGEAPIGDGRVTRFGGVDISSKPGFPTAFVRGAIRDKYRSLGAQNSFLGFASSDEICTGKGCYNAFTGDQFLLWSAPTGAHPSVGLLRQRYATLGLEHGWLGYPTTDENCGPRGCQQGYVGGNLWWQRGAGVSFTRGLIEQKYLQFGGGNGYLGFPRTDELCNPSGCRQEFASGDFLMWSPSTGAHNVNGEIRRAYFANGGPEGRLGYPTSDESCSNGGCRQSFSRGQITWSPATGAVVR